jgi:hypothetical protein
MKFKYDTATSLKAVTPDDGADLPDGVCRALWVGTGGNVTIIAEDDSSAVELTNIPDGTLVLVRTKRVTEATTASAIIALY